MIMCDDYLTFFSNHDKNKMFRRKQVKNMDKVIDAMIEFYQATPALTLAMAQGGDFIGGALSSNSDIQLLRKAMNTFL